MLKEIFDNRELSWLKFNKRVLEEALDKSNPLLERLSFFSIFQTNLDEFFQVRVGSHIEQMNLDNKKPKKEDISLLEDIAKNVKKLETLRDTEFKKILSELAQNNIIFDTNYDLLQKYFKKEIKPFLVPMLLSKHTPFPFLNNKTTLICLNFDDGRVGVIPLDENIQRFVLLQNEGGQILFTLAENVINYFADTVFKNYEIKSKTLLRITRNADLDVDEAFFDHDINYRQYMYELLRKRKKQTPVRIQLSNPDFKIPYFMLEKLRIHLPQQQIFYTESPFDFSFAGNIKNISKKAELNFKRVVPQKSAMTNSILTQVRKKDIFLSYPYESIRPFIKMLDEAAEDSNTQSISITLYRLARNSKIIDALVHAVENGKQVTVLVELRARFDEENNIGWSRKLENAGCRVIYGPKEYKVHSKLLLIKREVKGVTEYITQIGTGNYNEKTATLYTDYSLITANREIAEDAEKVFRLLSDQITENSTASNFTLSENTELPKFSHLLVSPINLRDSVIAFIEDEIEKAKNGKNAYVGAKLNSLTDRKIMEKLAEASKAGVKIDLLIRGVCCLIPGIPGETENITVISVVGRYLEHSRVYIFGHGDDKKVYISSADYMTRNTIRRLEVAVPILNTRIRGRILSMFSILLKDNVKGRILGADGEYTHKKKTRGKAVNAQEFFIQQAYTAADKKDNKSNAK